MTRLRHHWDRAAVALAVLGLFSQAAFGKLPEWARLIAETAPPLEQDLPETTTRILFNEIHVSVSKEGSLTSRWRQAAQALSARVEKFNVRGVPYDEDSRVMSARAWHLPTGEKGRRSYVPPIDLTVDDNFLTDSKTRFIGVDGVTRGSLVFFEFQMSSIPKMLALEHQFFDGAVTTLDRFEIETPSSGWTLRSDWLRSAGVRPVIEGNLWRWEMRDLPEPVKEALAEEPPDAAPLLVVALTPPPGISLAPRVMADWAAFGAWIEDLYKGREAPTPEIAAAARKAAPGKEFFERVRSTGLLVRDKVRYLATGISIGHIQPHPAGETFSQLYGDCKDKATLLRSFLAAGKQPSYPVLVNLTSPATVSATIPSPQAFNHVILAVPLAEGVTVLPRFAPAVVDGGDLGQLLIVDATNTYADIGSLPASLAGKKALVIAGPRSRLIDLPVPGAASHTIDRRIRTEVQEDGSLSIERVLRLMGEPATQVRASYRTSAVDRRKTVERTFLDAFIHAEPKGYNVDPETPEGLFIETTTWTVPSDHLLGDLKEIPLFPGAADVITRVSLSKRTMAVLYPFPMTVRYDSTVRGVPASAVLPRAESRKGPGWSVVSKFTRAADGRTVDATWELVLSHVRFEPADFPELKKLWSAIGTTGRVAIHSTEPSSGQSWEPGPAQTPRPSSGS